MRREGHLFEQVADFATLRRAAKAASKGKRLSNPAAEFMLGLESHCLDLERQLSRQTWRPGPFHDFLIYDRKPRIISAAPFADRVVHHAVSAVIEPSLERHNIFDCYACRKGKGTHAALERARHFCRARGYFLKLDISRYFHSVDHEILLNMLRRRFKDRRLLDLLELIVRHAPPDCKEGRGLAIGNLTSQHFANFYLAAHDHFVKEELRVKRYLRYMDDMLFFHEDKQTLKKVMNQSETFLRDELHLALNERVTRLAPVSEGVPFLGFVVLPGTTRLSPENARRFRRKYRRLRELYLIGALDEESLHRRGVSMVGHISHADTLRFRRSFFGRLEKGEGT